jgi:hypothetical protein
MRRGPAGGSGDRSPAPGSPQPMSRRPLGLLPRSSSSTAPNSLPTSPNASSPSSPALSSAAPLASKPSPFGAARPVDNAAKAKEVEEKLAKQEAESRERRQREKEAREAKAKQFVRAPPVGDRRQSANNSPKPEEGAKKVEGDVREEDNKAGDEKAPVTLAPEVVVSPKRANAPLKETKEEKAKREEKAFSFSALEVEGGEDDDEEVNEVADKVKETSI